MTHISIRLTALLSLGTLAGCAHLQPTQSWPELLQRVGPGKPVAVTDARGAEVRGKVSALSAASLTLNVEGVSRLFESKDVRQVRRDGDPLWNGLAIGAAMGVFAAAFPDNKCSGVPLRCDDKQILARVTFLAVATGAGIGIDALHRDRTVLYGSPPRALIGSAPLPFCYRDGSPTDLARDKWCAAESSPIRRVQRATRYG